MKTPIRRQLVKPLWVGSVRLFQHVACVLEVLSDDVERYFLER